MMTLLEACRNFQHSHLKTKKFEEIQALYEKIKRSDEDFIAIGSVEDERMLKEMNEKGIDYSKIESVKEESKEEEGTKKRKSGHIKMIARKKLRKQSELCQANGNYRAFHKLDGVERRYPLFKELLQRMLDLGLEVKRESYVALDLIRFIKQHIDKE
ncbi:hypothetical protein Tco_0903688 [Tanacetum coccineum]